MSIKFELGKKNRQLLGALLLAFGTSGLVIATSYLKIFQLLEWSAYDNWFRMRSTEAPEERIVVVTIDESDIRNFRQWPMSDDALSRLINKIRQQQPRAIGLDIYRDLSVPPGTQELETVLKSTPNLIGVEKIIGQSIKSSPILKEQNQIALSDLVRDRDSTIRRGLLSVELDDGQIQLGLATRLALMYLASVDVFPESIENTGKIALGKVNFTPFNRNDGGYIGADDGGFQILINYRGTEKSFIHISITDVLNDKVADNLFRERLVLIGSTAPSLNDFFPTPYSDSRESQLNDLPGVFIHANIASQIINGALNGRNSIKTVNEPLEWAWVFVWTYSALMLNIFLLNFKPNHQKKNFTYAFLGIVISCLTIAGSSYILFLNGFWLTVINPIFSVAVSGILINWYYKTNQEEQQQKLAFTDSLTAIPNRRFFDEFFYEQWQKSQQNKKSLSIILCDVDFFKKYNDTYGHQAGDLCLQQVGKVLAQSVRDNDLAARYGGEEFVAVLPNTPPNVAVEIARRIGDRLRGLQIPHVSSQVSEYVTISCGIACTSLTAVNSPEELVKYADKALYLAKEQGRDRAVLWSDK